MSRTRKSTKPIPGQLALLDVAPRFPESDAEWANLIDRADGNVEVLSSLLDEALAHRNAEGVPAGR